MNTLKPIRVAMVIQDYHPVIGGAERQIAAQAPLLAALNVHIDVITRRYKGLTPFEQIGPVSVYRMPSWGPKPTAAISYILSGWWKILQLKPDIIHAFELLSPATISILAKYCLRIPLLAKVLRGGKLGDLAKIGRGLIGPIRIGWIKNSVDMFAVISREIDDELVGVGIGAEKRTFIPNGVDIEHFSPILPDAKNSLRSQIDLPAGLMVLYAGRFEPEKRIDQLIALWPKILEKFPEAWLILVGTGSEEGRLRQIASEHIHFAGPVVDVAPYLQAADLFVLPSSTEGLSNAMLEAMSCGLPIVATSVGGATDVITHAQNGWLIPADSFTALYDSLSLLLADEPLRNSLGLKGRELIVHRYSLPAVVKSLRELYDEILEHGDQGRKKDSK